MSTAATAPKEVADRDGVVLEGPNFQQFIQQIEDGNMVDDATRDLHRLVSEINHLARNQGGNPRGKITLDIDLTRVGDVWEVFAKVKMTPPKPKRARSLFYEHKGSLTANNPKQISMDLGGARNASVAEAPPVRVVE